VKEDSLVISSEKKNSTEETTEKFTRKEWSYNSFSRSFTLPETVNREGILAEYENGVLKVVLPKMEEVKKNKAIEVAVK
jgi:HSP20 family protein